MSPQYDHDDWNSRNDWDLKAILIIIITAILFAIIAIHCGGCKSIVTERITYYESGKIQSTFYETDNSFKFFSEGSGKTIEISPSVNGVGL